MRIYKFEACGCHMPWRRRLFEVSRIYVLLEKNSFLRVFYQSAFQAFWVFYIYPFSARGVLTDNLTIPMGYSKGEHKNRGFTLCKLSHD